MSSQKRRTARPWVSALLSLMALMLVSSAPAFAQVFTIAPANPATTGGNNSQGPESFASPTFTVTLTGGAASTTYSVNIVLDDGPSATTGAKLNQDFLLPSVNTISIATGGAAQTFTVPIINDESYENDETFTIRLNGPTNGATLGGNFQSVYKILKEDPRPRIRVRDVTVGDTRESPNDPTGEGRFVEGNSTTSRTFVVDLVGASNLPRVPAQLPGGALGPLVTTVDQIDFNYDFQSGDGTDPSAFGLRAPNSASLGSDFTGLFNSASIAAGGHETTISFDVVGDTLDETNESFIARILSPTNVVNPAGAIGRGIILDDDAPSATISNVNVIEGNLGNSTTASFAVQLSQPSIQKIELSYIVTSQFPFGGTAQENIVGPNTVSDFVQTVGILTFLPGETQKFINVPVNGDNLNEADETILAHIDNYVGVRYDDDADADTEPNPAFPAISEPIIPETVTRGVQIINSPGIGTIINDDIVGLSINDATVVEGTGGVDSIMEFRVTLSQISDQTITVLATTQAGGTGPGEARDDGTAALGTKDFNPITAQMISFSPGETEKFFQVHVNHDSVDELDEIFTVTLTQPSNNAVLGDDQATGTIVDDDGPTISINNVTQNEGNSGTTTFDFTVTLGAASPQTVTVNYRTIETAGQASSVAPNPDFAEIPPTPVSTLTFAPGELTKTISVTVNGDNIFEPTETFIVRLSGATNASPTFVPTDGTGTITNDDLQPVVTINNPSIDEGGNAVFTVTLSNPSYQTVSVQYQTAAATATAVSDYQTTAGTLVFNPATINAAAETSKTISVPTVDDNMDEIDETFNLNIPAVTNATLSAPSPRTATILDNDGPAVSISAPAAVTEGATGDTTNAVFTVSIPTTSLQPVTFDYSVGGGNATSGVDYTATSGSGTIPIGDTSTTITVPVLGDALDELDETFNVTLSNVDNATNGTLVATGTIADDDDASISFDSDVTVNEGNTGTTTATFKVELATTSNRTITVDYTIAANTATAGTDYTTTSGTLTFAPGETEKTIDVSIIGDTLDEADETFFVNLTNPTNSTITDNQAIGTITDDDAATLALTITPSTFVEGSTTSATVTRNSSTTAPLTVTLASTDASAATVPTTVTIEAGQSSAIFTVTGTEDVIADGSQTSTITADAAGHAQASAGVTVTDNDAVALSFAIDKTSISEGGTTATGTVTRNTPTVAGLTVNISSSDTTEATVPTSVVIAAGDNSATFPITPVEDIIVDGTQPVTISVSATGFTSASKIINVTDNDTAGVTIDPTTVLTTSETGTTATFTVRLNTQPTADVTIGLSSSDTTEGTVSPSSLTFTPANYSTPKPVTVTGVNDDLKDGAVQYKIITTNTSSTDPGYNNVEVADVNAINTDDQDTPGILISTNGALATSEAGRSASFTVLLTSQPTETVTVSVASSDATEGTASPAALTFTAANWNVGQTVTVTGVDDAEQDGDVDYQVNVTSSSLEADFNNLPAEPVAVINLDNDTASIIVTPVTGLVTTEAGGTATFTIKLNSQPASNVAIGLTSSDITEGTVSPSAVTFNPANWNAAQTVTVTGVDDVTTDGEVAYRIVTAPARSDDRNYNNTDTSDVSVVNRDNDVAGITLISNGVLTTTEEKNGTANFSIVLKSQPTEPVYIVVRSSDLTEGKVIPENVVFTPVNWSTPQQLQVAGIEDSVVDGDISYKISIFRVLSSNRAYNSLKVAQLPTLSAVNKDNDDRTKPVITVTTPVNGGTYGNLTAATGTASDAGLGSAGLKITGFLQRFANAEAGTTTGYYAGGNTFTATYNPAFNERPAQGTANWTINFPTLTPGRYAFRARAVDGRGNVTTSPVINFTISRTPPTVTIRTPSSGGFVSNLTNIAGTAVPVGRLTISKVSVSIRRVRDGLYFNGTTFVPGAASIPATVDGRNYSLTEDLPTAAQLGAGQFEIKVTATDSGGNSGSATTTFRVDNVAPTIAITVPENNQTLDALTNISGTVSDNADGSGISRVEILILRRSDSTYFNGSDFVPLPASGVAPSVRATVSGTVFRWAGQLPTDPDAFNSFYRLQAVAYDRAGNRTGSNTVNVGVAAPQLNASQGEASKIGLSIASANAGTSTVVLTFSAPLDADSLSDAKFSATANGDAVTVEGASLRNSSTVVLLLADGALEPGAAVNVQWSGLRDTAGKTIAGKSQNVIAK